MLTKKQLDLLAFIHKRVQRDGVPPSFDEMKEALDLRSKSGIHRLITALEERGFIRRLAHRARAIEVVKLPDSLGSLSGAGFTPRVIDGDRPDGPPPSAAQPVSASSFDVPMMGRIAAGVPIEAISTMTQSVAVPSGMISGSGEHYALEVQGDSMIDAGINDGDVVIIRETSVADDGDIVAGEIIFREQFAQLHFNEVKKFLIVHQQDIQAVVNAMWRGGASAVTVQGQRIVSTTGIKCEANSVTLQGVPYPQPYVIEAVGDPTALAASVQTDPYLAFYRSQAIQEDIRIGWDMVEDEVDAPAYDGLLDLSYAEPLEPTA